MDRSMSDQADMITPMLPISPMTTQAEVPSSSDAAETSKSSSSRDAVHSLATSHRSSSWTFLNGQLSPQAGSARRLMSLTSTFSDGTICRICHENDTKEELISPCKCSGTMGMLHQSCIEAWLSSSNTTRCEICNYEYIVEREDRPFKEWLQRPASPQDRKNIVADMLCFGLLTPLAAVSCWLCVSGAAHFYSMESNDGHYWESIGLISLTVFLVSIYIIWISVAIRYHCRVWHEWKQRNKRVTILNYDVPSMCSNSSQSSPSRASRLSACEEGHEVMASQSDRTHLQGDESLQEASGGAAGLMKSNVDSSHSFVSYCLDWRHGLVCDLCHQPVSKHKMVAVQRHKVEIHSPYDLDPNNNCGACPNMNQVAAVMSYVPVPLLKSGIVISSSYPTLKSEHFDSVEIDEHQPRRPLSFPHGVRKKSKVPKPRTQSVSTPEPEAAAHSPSSDKDWGIIPTHSSTPRGKKTKKCTERPEDTVQACPKVLRPKGASHDLKRYPSSIHSQPTATYTRLDVSSGSESKESSGKWKKRSKKIGSQEKLLNVSDTDCNTSVSSQFSPNTTSSDEPRSTSDDSGHEVWLGSQRIIVHHDRLEFPGHESLRETTV